MNAPQTFTITPTQYETLLAKAQAAGVPISGNSGTATKDGVTVEWEYDAVTLSIAVESRAWYDPSISDIQAKITALVDEALE
jgi:hypothetical protein